MHRPLAIRQPQEIDLSDIAALFANEQFGEDALQRLQKAFAHIREFSLIAMSDDGIKGALIATFNGWHVFASHLAVVTTARRQGVGRLLVETLFVHADRVGAKGIIADARLSAVGFCHELGFRLPGAIFLVHDLRTNDPLNR